MDIALNTSHDLDTSKLDFTLVSGSERVRQQLLIKLRLWVGEWFLDNEFGTPYLERILGKQVTIAASLAAIRQSILEVADVIKINELTYEFSNLTRTLKVNFVVDTPYGALEVSQ